MNVIKKHPTSLRIHPGQIPHFQHSRLAEAPGLRHGVFTRLGGVSAPPYATLNTSFSVGDVHEHVESNLARIQSTLGAERLFIMEQVHGDAICVLRRPDAREFSSPPCVDAVITDVPGVAVMVKQADCQGIILFDPERHMLAAIHCGWRGNVCNIIRRVVLKMAEEFGCKTSRVLAAIGPALGPCCGEFVTHEEIFPQQFKAFMHRKDYFDLWNISRWQLMEAGIEEEHIEIAAECTRCRTDLFYSYRAEGVTGRFATAAMLL